MFTNINKIMSTLMANGMVIIDDHDNKQHKAQMILIRTTPDGDIQLCLGFKKSYTPYFSVNPLYINDKDNKVHLSTWSVGGTVDYRYAMTEQEGIDQYNRAREEHPQWDQDRLSILNIA